MQETVEGVESAPSVREYIVNLAAASRKDAGISVGVSPWGSAALLRACQAWAAFAGRSYIVPEDVQDLAPYVWSHRILVGPGQDIETGRKAISSILEWVPVPL